MYRKRKAWSWDYFRKKKRLETSGCKEKKIPSAEAAPFSFQLCNQKRENSEETKK